MSSNENKGFTAFSSTGSSSSSSGFAFKPSALARFTTHIDTKVVSNQNSDVVENSHTPEVLKFLSSKPEDLSASDSKNAVSPGGTNSSTFVFGKNINSRVTNVPDEGEVASPSSDCLEKSEKNTSGIQQSPSSVDKKGDNNEQDVEKDCEIPTSTGLFLAASKGLIKSSSEGENKEDKKSLATADIVEKTVFHSPENLSVFNSNRLPPPVASIETGEENEDTLFHATCKLHVFDSQKNTWLERGRGLVKINRDRTTHKCRIIMRQQSILRLLMNSPIFPDMRLKQVSARGIHVTATEVDTGAMRVFLLTSTTPTEATHLFHYLSNIIDDLSSSDNSGNRHDGAQDEWHAAEGTRSSKHGRRDSGQEDLSGNKRGSSRCVESAKDSDIDEGDEDVSDDGRDHHRAKRALTVLPNTNAADDYSNNSHSQSSVDSNRLSSTPLSSEDLGRSGLDDSLSSHQSTNDKSPAAKVSNVAKNNGNNDNNNNKSTSDLKLPRIIKTNTDGVRTIIVSDDEQKNIDA